MTTLRDFQAEIQQTHTRSLARQRAQSAAGEGPNTEHRHQQSTDPTNDSLNAGEEEDILVCPSGVSPNLNLR